MVNSNFQKDVIEAALPVIKYFEGFRSTPYFCPAGVKTVGYGFTTAVISEHELNKTWSEPQAADVLRRVLATNYYPQLTKHVTERTLERLGVYRAAALLSAVYNLGAGGVFASKFLARVQAGQASYTELAQHLQLYCRANGNILKGLQRRRKVEAEMLEFNKPLNTRLL